MILSVVNTVTEYGKMIKKKNEGRHLVNFVLCSLLFFKSRDFSRLIRWSEAAGAELSWVGAPPKIKSPRGERTVQNGTRSVEFFTDKRVRAYD